jgi:hypothetical protein
MSLTTDPNDPRLGHGVDESPKPQNKTYLVLSEEERAKGFIRPVRQTYRHVGNGGPKHPTRALTDEEQERFKAFRYVRYEPYPVSETAVCGKYWTQAELDQAKGCGCTTTMAFPLAQTYARDPKFYGSTYCCECSRHLPVREFVWDGTDEVVGS